MVYGKISLSESGLGFNKAIHTHLSTVSVCFIKQSCSTCLPYSAVKSLCNCLECLCLLFQREVQSQSETTALATSLHWKYYWITEWRRWLRCYPKLLAFLLWHYRDRMPSYFSKRTFSSVIGIFNSSNIASAPSVLLAGRSSRGSDVRKTVWKCWDHCSGDILSLTLAFAQSWSYFPPKNLWIFNRSL